jgi:superfamily II DNA or RNA helicase
MNTIEKGTKYEKFIKNYLDENKDNEVWLWKDIPEKHLRKSHILGEWNEYRLKRKDFKNNSENELIDTGCDLLLRSNEKYYIIQCKNYEMPNSVQIHHLGGFYMMMVHYDLDGILYYTSKLSSNIKCQKSNLKIQYIKKNIEKDEDKVIELENYSNLINNPYDYQIDASNKINNVFLTKNRAILQLPCGLGKTLISMMIGLNYDEVIIISPLKQYTIQNLDRFKSELKYKDHEGLIIDSDGTRDVNYISDFIKKNKKIILSVTYKSCDVLYEVLSKLNNYIIIIDEFHNITQNDLLGLNDNGLNSILLSDSKILFMSATPRLFEIEDETEDNDSIESSIDDEIFGNIEYLYNMGDAIKTNKICDYEIYVPDIQLNNNIFIDDIKKEINIHNLSNEVMIKSNFLLRGMLETGSRKCILYAKTQEEAHNFKETFIKMNEYFVLDIWTDTILSNDNKQNRINKIKYFTDFNGFSIIINVEILNECIDIKECDSVYITYPSQSRIKNIQRICRANRKDKNNLKKISKIFLWTDEYNEMVDTISHLKEFDNSFMIDKIKIISLNNNNEQILERTEHIKKYEILDDFILNVKKVLTWDEKYNNLINYIEENGELPSIGDKDIKIKQLAAWHQTQKKNYDKKIKMMKHEKYNDIWKNFMEEYPKYFLNHEQKWIQKLDKVKKFMKDNNNSPSRYSKDEYEKDLGSWISTQKENFKKNIKLFSHENILKIWDSFQVEYKDYLLNNTENWYFRLNQLKIYIEQNKCRPSCHSKDKEIKSLGTFILTQNKNYKDKTQIMSDKIIYDIWSNFLKEYNIFSKDEDDIWYDNLNELDEYLILHKKRPKKTSKDIYEKKLGNWIGHQIQNFNKNVNNMKKENVRNDFQDFLSKHKNIFKNIDV